MPANWYFIDYGISVCSINTGRMIFFLLAGEGEFANDVLELGGVGGDGKDEYLAVVDGADDFLAPHGGALDAGLVYPDGDTGLPEQGDKILNPFPIGRAVTDENFLRHEIVAAERKL